MIIWIVALVVVGLAAVAGWNRGAVRAAISLSGLLVAALLAMPLAGLFKPVISFLGLKHPFLLVFVAPIIAFLFVLIAFKIGGHQVYTKIDYWLKYRATEMQRAQFERMSTRVGLCVGVINGIVYFIAIMVPVYVASHFTLQMPLGDEPPPMTVRMMNSLGGQLRDAKMDNVVAGFDPAPASYYEAADILGLLMNNYPLHSRLSRYPTLLILGERPEFQEIANDVEVLTLFANQAPLSELLKNPKIQGVTTNRETALEIQKLLTLEELKDLKEYLKTGVSPKYSDERILGLWVLTVEGSAAELKKQKPQITSRDLSRFKSMLYMQFPDAELVVTTDNKAVFKVADPNATPSFARPVLRGTWEKSEAGYQMKLTGNARRWTGRPWCWARNFS